MLGASVVYAFEIDNDAIEIALSNISEVLEDEDDSNYPIQLIQCQVNTDFTSGSPIDVLSRFDSFFDVVS